MKKVAYLLESHTGIPNSNAILEAVWMASDDGLFAEDQFKWDLKTGNVYAKLLCCFPKSWQNHGKCFVPLKMGMLTICSQSLKKELSK